jgi:MoxR-like ATPase
MSKSSKKIESTQLKPSEISAAIRAAMKTDRSAFIWGPPGISKSQVSSQIATDMGIAFVDFRLSQLDPTDLRGIPYPTKVGGREGVRWSIPYALPVDMDLTFTVRIDDADETRVEVSNPKGSNGIHYVTNPRIRVTSLTDGVTAQVIQQYETDEDGEVVYYDDEGTLVKALTGTPVVDFLAAQKLGKHPANVAPVKVNNLDSVVILLTDDATGKPTTGRVRIVGTGKARAVLALEEFNSAPPSVQASAYQFVLDRRLGEYIVPKGVKIIAMGNRDTDKGVTYKMPTPIANRFIHLEMRPDFEDWQIWALKHEVHPDVVGYLSAFKQQLFDFDPGTAARGFATPRSWHYVSDLLQQNGDLPEMVGVGLVTGSVGDGPGLQFWEFRKIARDLPEADKILSGQLKKMPRQVEISLAYALTTTLCYELKERYSKFERKQGWQNGEDYKKWMSEADNFIEFLMENFQPEISIMATRAAVQVHKLPFHMSKMKNFLKFAEKYRSLVMS